MGEAGSWPWSLHFLTRQSATRPGSRAARAAAAAAAAGCSAHCAYTLGHGAALRFASLLGNLAALTQYSTSPSARPSSSFSSASPHCTIAAPTPTLDPVSVSSRPLSTHHPSFLSRALPFHHFPPLPTFLSAYLTTPSHPLSYFLSQHHHA
ncbi:hypothetical protein F5883DRAFT_59651 [Diaporthe sp. PMI_573]|nr:hypothetical protein F5883DRAFT_59651 [Diaporthaceae sp. PMI_573]